MNWEIVIGVSSTVIALCAMGLSIFEGYQSRKHNRISCRPHLTSNFNSNGVEGHYSFKIFSNGLGPAIITKFKVLKDGQAIDETKNDPLYSVINDVITEPHYKAMCLNIFNEHSISSGDSCVLFELDYDKDKIPLAENVEKGINRIDIIIEYESFYGEKFVFSTQNEKPNK